MIKTCQFIHVSIRESPAIALAKTYLTLFTQVNPILNTFTLIDYNVLNPYLVVINYRKLVVYFRARVVSFQMSIIQGVDNIL